MIKTKACKSVSYSKSRIHLSFSCDVQLLLSLFTYTLNITLTVLCICINLHAYSIILHNYNSFSYPNDRFFARVKQKFPLRIFFESLFSNLTFCLMECTYLGVNRCKIATPYSTKGNVMYHKELHISRHFYQMVYFKPLLFS